MELHLFRKLSIIGIIDDADQYRPIGPNSIFWILFGQRDIIITYHWVNVLKKHIIFHASHHIGIATKIHVAYWTCNQYCILSFDADYNRSEPNQVRQNWMQWTCFRGARSFPRSSPNLEFIFRFVWSGFRNQGSVKELSCPRKQWLAWSPLCQLP